jgi:N-methylhydantoinase B
LAVDIYQDGIVIPPLKVRLDTFEESAFVRILLSNIRMPDYTMGDLGAELAALATADRRLLELAQKYGIDTVQACMEEMMNLSETKTRARIREIPEGTYYGEDVIDGLSGDTLEIRATVTVKDDEMEVDFEGTSPQCNDAPLNSSFGGTVSAVYSYLKSILTGEEVPGNNGCNRPIRVRVPEGTLLNPYRPAAVGIRMQPVSRATDAIGKALAQAAPQLVNAPGNNSTLSVRFSQRALDTGHYHVFAETQGGCYGAGVGYDGEDAVAIPLTNVANVPVEALESENSFIRIKRYELNRGSSGPGQFRGGMGITRTYEILEPGVTFIGESDRHHSQPWGLEGGGSGGKGSFQIERKGETIELRPRGVFPLDVGDFLTLSTGGGGGYGDPKTRDRETLRREVEQGLILPQEAHDLYGFDVNEDS